MSKTASTGPNAPNIVGAVASDTREAEESVGADKTEDMRKRARRGQPVAGIARKLHVSKPTARKYRDAQSEHAALKDSNLTNAPIPPRS